MPTAPQTATQSAITADSVILSGAVLFYDGFAVVDQIGLRYNVGLEVDLRLLGTSAHAHDSSSSMMDRKSREGQSKQSKLTAVARLTAPSSARLELSVVKGHCDGVPPGSSCTVSPVLIGLPA